MSIDQEIEKAERAAEKASEKANALRLERANAEREARAARKQARYDLAAQRRRDFAKDYGSRLDKAERAFTTAVRERGNIIGAWLDLEVTRRIVWAENKAIIDTQFEWDHAVWQRRLDAIRRFRDAHSAVQQQSPHGTAANHDNPLMAPVNREFNQWAESEGLAARRAEHDNRGFEHFNEIIGNEPKGSAPPPPTSGDLLFHLSQVANRLVDDEVQAHLRTWNQ